MIGLLNNNKPYSKYQELERASLGAAALIVSDRWREFVERRTLRFRLGVPRSMWSFITPKDAGVVARQWDKAYVLETIEQICCGYIRQALVNPSITTSSSSGLPSFLFAFFLKLYGSREQGVRAVLDFNCSILLYSKTNHRIRIFGSLFGISRLALGKPTQINDSDFSSGSPKKQSAGSGSPTKSAVSEPEAKEKDETAKQVKEKEVEDSGSKLLSNYVLTSFVPEAGEAYMSILLLWHVYHTRTKCLLGTEAEVQGLDDALEEWASKQEQSEEMRETVRPPWKPEPMPVPRRMFNFCEVNTIPSMFSSSLSYNNLFGVNNPNT